MPMIDASVVKVCWEGMMWEENADAGTFWGRKRCGEDGWGRRGTGRSRSSRTLGVDEGGMILRGEEIPGLGRGSAVQNSPGAL